MQALVICWVRILWLLESPRAVWVSISMSTQFIPASFVQPVSQTCIGEVRDPDRGRDHRIPAAVHHLWAPWCGVFRRFSPSIQRLAFCR